jgi:hypothetical protein
MNLFGTLISYVNFGNQVFNQDGASSKSLKYSMAQAISSFTSIELGSSSAAFLN